MRPTFFALCAAGLLLAPGAHCASADEAGSLAPLISSGSPSSAAAGPATGARRMLSDDDPVSPAEAESAPLRQELQRHEPMRLRDESTLGDQSWTSAPVQPAGSANESSRSVKHFSDSGATRPGGAGSLRANPSAAPQPISGQPISGQREHSQLASRPSATASAPVHSASVQDVPFQAVPVQAADGVYASSPSSHLRSHVAQAQYTSPEPNSAEPSSAETRTDSRAAAAVGDVHRPLKPPTANDSATDEKRSGGTVQMFVSVISSLLIVVGLLLGAAWCYRKATPNLAGSLPKQALQVLGRTPLAPRQQLILVRFGPKLVLMSNLQGEVRAISEIVDPLEVDRLCGMCESSQAGSISDSFRTVLHNIGRTG